ARRYCRGGLRRRHSARRKPARGHDGREDQTAPALRGGWVAGLFRKTPGAENAGRSKAPCLHQEHLSERRSLCVVIPERQQGGGLSASRPALARRSRIDGGGGVVRRSARLCLGGSRAPAYRKRASHPVLDRMVPSGGLALSLLSGAQIHIGGLACRDKGTS